MKLFSGIFCIAINLYRYEKIISKNAGMVDITSGKAVEYTYNLRLFENVIIL